MKTYKVNRITPNQLKITGKLDSPLWKKANSLSNFLSPWIFNQKTETIYRALWDEKYLFFCFEVLDDSIYVNKKDNSFQSINVSDRVELFFRLDNSLNPYYCLEIDPTLRIMDFKAYPGKDFDFSWNWPDKQLKVKSNITEKGFIVEGRISIDSLRSLSLIKEDKIETGIFRAKYIVSNETTNTPIWLTWVNPKTKSPNFHTPSSFGILELQ